MNSNRPLPPIRCNVCGHPEETVDLMDKHFDVHRAPLHRVPEEGAKIVTTVPVHETHMGETIVDSPVKRSRTYTPRGRNQEIITNIMSTKRGPMTLEKITEFARSMNDKQDSSGVWHALNVLAAQGKVRKVKQGVYEWVSVGVERPVTQVRQPVGSPLPIPITVKVREEKPLFSIPNCNDCLTPMTVCTPDTPRTGLVLLINGIHYTCTNRECPAGKSKATPVTPVFTPGIQDLLVRAQSQSLALARTLGELSEIIGPFLTGLDGLLRAKGENDGSGKDQKDDKGGEGKNESIETGS